MLAARSLYIHVPFCARRCSYCDFAVEATRRPPVDAWIDAIGRELALVAPAARGTERMELDTLYLGGGTPSLLGEGAVARLLEGLAAHVRLAPEAEFTCEANPESFDAALARDWRDAGVNRISLGAQTFHAETLRWMGRLHGPDGPRQAIDAARGAGFENVSVDLIFGVPDRLGRDWRDDLERALDLGVDHISLYGLTAEAGAPLGRWVGEGREVLADDDRYADEYLLAHRLVTDAGLEHYEVSNFGRPAAHSRHNFAYWSGAPYLALGPGAHGYQPPVRRWNLRSWSAYRDALLVGQLPVAGEEKVDGDAAALEHTWLGLRTRRGLMLEKATRHQRLLADLWAANGLAEPEGDILRLTPEGWLLLDRLAVEFHDAGGTDAVAAAAASTMKGN